MNEAKLSSVIERCIWPFIEKTSDETRQVTDQTQQLPKTKVVSDSANMELFEKKVGEETFLNEVDPLKQSIGSNLLTLMQKNTKKTKPVRRFNFKVDFEEIDRIMEEEDESAPIVMPI